MTDSDGTAATFSEDIGGLTLEYTPVSTDVIRLTAYHDGDVLVRGEYDDPFAANKRGRDQRGEFLNNLEEAVADIEGIPKAETRAEFRQWFDSMGDLEKEEEEKYLLPGLVKEIINGTHHVEIHGGETTTWNVELTFAGRTNELEFTAAEMTGKGGAAELEEKIANQFYEIIEIEPEDWDAIRGRWHEDAEVVSVIEETAEDAVADRVLSQLAHGIKPVGTREDMGNDVAAAWYDEENNAAYADAGADASIVWVQDDFLVDQLEAAGQQLSYKSQLVKDLISRGELYGSRIRRNGEAWPWDTRTKLYPFTPESLGVDPDDVAGTGDPNHSEVSA